MKTSPFSPSTLRPPAAPRGAGAGAREWSLGWSLALAAAGAALVALLGVFSWPVMAALAAAALPGLLGFALAPARQGRAVLLVLWALAAGLAVSLVGGPAGPLGAWCALPLLAGAAMEMLAAGAALAAATLACAALVGLAGFALPAPGGAFGLALAAVSLATLGGAAAGAFAVARRAHLQAAADAELARSLEAALAAERHAGALEARAREAEAARELADSQARAKSRFLANMSHELRTPLNAIIGFSDIMRARMFGELPGKYGEYAELIHESGRHLMDLINDLLDVSKIEAERYTLSREVFDAREAVNAALRLMRLQADDAGVQLRGLLPSEPLIVDADRRALKQIVLNLVSNALKFTPPEGSVTVTVGAADGAFELVVADTGMGIAKEDLERLGRPYEQAGDATHKAQGTGLGLSLVKALAKLHGGEMSIESALGEGAAITVRMPVLAEAPVEPPEAEPVPQAAAGPEAAADPEAAPPQAAEARGRSAQVIPLNRPR